MSSTDDDSKSRPAPSGFPLWWAPGQKDLQRERKAQQVRMIVAAFDAAGTPVGIYPSDDHPEDMEFMYRRGFFLTRDVDAERVYRALERPLVVSKDREDLPPPVAGLHVVPLAGNEDVIGTLERLDRALGKGVAVPDHVVHLTGLAGGCPATEPLPAAGTPDPPISADEDCDGGGVLVSVIDTGLIEQVRDEHPWLARITGDPEQANVGHYRGHGTFIAGVVRAMAPRTQIHVEALLYNEGSLLESDLVPRLGRALDLMPDIISMSAGTATRERLPLLGLQVFWEERLRHAKGTVLVCAAGNDGVREPFWPAAFPWSVSVGALDVDGSRAGYSNFGSWVDVYARGSDVVNAYPKGEYHYQEDPLAGQSANFITGLASWSGTSFSTPLVSGLIAARMSWSGESARVAADALLEMARENATPRVGAVLEPGMGCRPHSHRRHCGGGHGGCGHDEHSDCRCGSRTCC